MSARLLALVAPLLLAGCLQAWPVGGPWKCSSGDTCPGGLTCDDGVCCDPAGAPACPTLPLLSGGCPGGAPTQTVYEDADHDGHGNPQVVRVQCAAPRTGTFVANFDDCDDSHPNIHPGAEELCNGADDNCDGQIDEGLTPRTPWYADADGDGVGAGAATLACVAPPGMVAATGDCAPDDPARYPGAPERCNGVDDNCNNSADEGVLADTDVAGDDHPRFPCNTHLPGLCGMGSFQCAPSGPGGVNARTCLSLHPPAARDVCNGLDDDCDGVIDERPDCGGPRYLVGTPDTHAGAFWLTSSSKLFTQCQKSLRTAGHDEPFTGANVQGGDAGYHVIYFEPADGGTWDLSRYDLTLDPSFTATFAAVGGNGMWGQPPSAPFNPTVCLCGATDTEKLRYRVLAASASFSGDDTAFALPLPLSIATSQDWLVGAGSGFDTSHVSRIELVLWSAKPGFELHFSPDAGFWGGH